MESLAMIGVHILGKRSRWITIFGGKLWTASSGEVVVSGIIAFVVFVIFGSFSLDTERRNWTELYRKGIIDKSEYYRNRFNFF